MQRKIPQSLISAICLAVFLQSAPNLHADEPPEELKEQRFRITGLFMPEREADLHATFEQIPEFQLREIDFEHGEILVRYDAVKVFPNLPADQFLARFDHLVRNASNSTFMVKPLCEIPREKLEHIVIPIEGLDCKGCSYAAYRFVFQIEGVEQATASFQSGEVTAWINPAKTNRSALENALTQRGVKLKIELTTETTQ